MSKKTLIAYYSWSGRTKRLAEKIAAVIGDSDIFEIKVPAGTFSQDMYETSDIATKQIKDHNLPKLTDQVNNLNDYQTILVGGPVWSNAPSSSVDSFLQVIQGFQGTVAPFYTDAGSFDKYEGNFADMAGSLHVVEGLEADDDIQSWFDRIKN
ncbi:flavodoxin [Companilactobacillus sp.]|uniref:flavodoxin n=1 Tax=Companilactobacillus sp. TaxID=2767905 RepID=UPI00260C1691|nr:flavodoxin [Companilactobacillus sp.]